MIGKNKGSNFCIPIQCITGVALSNKTKTKAMYRCILVGLLPLVFMLIQIIKNAHGDNHNKLKIVHGRVVVSQKPQKEQQQTPQST